MCSTKKIEANEKQINCFSVTVKIKKKEKGGGFKRKTHLRYIYIKYFSYFCVGKLCFISYYVVTYIDTGCSLLIS